MRFRRYFNFIKREGLKKKYYFKNGEEEIVFDDQSLTIEIYKRYTKRFFHLYFCMISEGGTRENLRTIMKKEGDSYDNLVELKNDIVEYLKCYSNTMIE